MSVTFNSGNKRRPSPSLISRQYFVKAFQLHVVMYNLEKTNKKTIQITMETVTSNFTNATVQGENKLQQQTMGIL